MKTVRKPSPARSQGPGPRTPIRHKHRRTLSVGSARSNASGRLTALIQKNRNMESFAVSPLATRKSILSDNTEIEEPRRKSWWKNLGENSRDVIELLEENKVVEPNNIIEELDIEIISQEKKNYTMDLPDSSDSESISSIVIPQRKLFTQKENLPQKKFAEIIGTRETLAKLHKPDSANVDKNDNVPTRELFQNKQRSKPLFPAALLNISPNKTIADKTKDFATVEPKAQVRNIFGNRVTKRKNIFTNFIVSESEDEIPEIQPKVFGFQKKVEARRRGSSSSRGIREPSPTSSIATDIEMDDWNMLPSSTMVEHQLEIILADGNSPKRARLSKLIEIDSEAGSNATKQSNKSTLSKEMEKSRKSKTFTKEKAPETSMFKNTEHSDEAKEIFGENDEVPNKSRKSKTFIKEKATDSESMTTRNKSKTFQNDDVEEIVELNEHVLNKSSQVADKSRKSKTFTKDKAPESDSMTTRNRSRVSLEDNEEIFVDKNKSSKDKYKTFPKEKSPYLEKSMTNLNFSKVSQGEEEIFIQNEITQKKSKPKITDQNTSQSSIKTRSRSKNNSPNSSQIIDEEPTTVNTENNKTQTNKYKSIHISPKGKNIHTEETLLVTADQENNDYNELNFTLEYENEEMPETIQSKSNTKTRASKSMTQQENSVYVSKSNKTLPNKLIEESAELQSTQETSNRSLKVLNKSQAKDTSNVEDKIEINHERSHHINDVSNNSDSNNEDNEAVENLSENISEQVNDNDENDVENDDCKVQNDNELEKSQDKVDNNEDDEQNESHDIDNDSENQDEQGVQDQSGPDNVGQESVDEVDNNESQEVDDENDEEHNESEIEQNLSQEVEDENDEKEDTEQQNESEVEDQEESEVEAQEESEVEALEESEVEAQEESEVEAQEESEVEAQEESEVEAPEESEVEAQEESEVEDQEESEVEDQEESEVIADSDNENDEPNNSQDDVVNDSDNQDADQMENVQDELTESQVERQEEIETPNVSHDTTGRNRKKNESPEVILHDSNNHLESFAVQGRNTSVRKTEMIKSMNIRPSLASVSENTGFSDGKNSSAEGSGWDSHRITRKTLRQTFGCDITPRKSLRALVMEKSAKRQTQHNDVMSVTAKFPQANSTELPEMCNHYDDEVDENQESNHEVSIRTRQTILEEYLQKIKKKNTETRLKMEEAVCNSLNAPSKEHIFKVPAKPLFARRQTKPSAKPKQTKSTLFLGELPAEVIEDLKYKPPKRFQPSNAPWITKRLYKFLESKLEAKYDYKARVRAEKLVESIYHFAKDLRRHDVATTDAVDVLKREMARLDVVTTHFEFYEFFHQFMPREVRVKVVPDIVNKISLPRHGVFSDIL